MIAGLGTDLVRISRIRELMERFHERFVERCFTEREIARAGTKADPAAAFARLYAAKEAALKALGTGMREGLAWHNIEITHNALDAPLLSLTGGAAQLLQEKGLTGVKLHLSLSDDGDYAVATVLIET
jgi:holo-[acyl-carrier protein] synthase